MLKLITFCSYKFYLLKTRENIQVNARIGSNMLPLQFFTKLRILVKKFTNALFCIKRLKRVDALKRKMIPGYYFFLIHRFFSVVYRKAFIEQLQALFQSGKLLALHKRNTCPDALLRTTRIVQCNGADSVIEQVCN
jgi:hypothetical protein